MKAKKRRAAGGVYREDPRLGPARTQSGLQRIDDPTNNLHPRVLYPEPGGWRGAVSKVHRTLRLQHATVLER